MDAKALDRLANGLLTYYTTLYTEKYGKAPKINRYKEIFAMRLVIQSIDYDRAKTLLDFYFRIPGRSPHGLEWFKYNFEELDENLEALERDEIERAKKREETRRRVEEWQREHGSPGN